MVDDEKRFLKKITLRRIKWFLYYILVKELFRKTKRLVEDCWSRAILKENEERYR